MNETWKIVHKERRELINDLENLTDEQWRTPSLCDGWTVHDVLAHLVDTARDTKVSFIIGMLGTRFDFDRLNQIGVDREKRDDPNATLAEFRAVADRTSSPPASLATRLVEAMVHGEDIRRPLGISHEYPLESTIEALEYQLATSDSIGGSKERAAGLRLVAPDAGWSHGSGDEVGCNAVDLLLALTGRNVPAGSLTGAGAAKLTQAQGEQQ